MPSKKDPIEHIAAIREQLLVAIKAAYSHDRTKGEVAAVLCIIRIQQLVMSLKDGH